MKRYALREEAEPRQRQYENKKQLPEMNAGFPHIREEDNNQAIAKRAGRLQEISPHKWMPPFDERKDDLDASMVRFEKAAESQKWDKVQRASALSVCL